MADEPPPAAGEVRLRAVAESDLPVLFEHQRDPDAVRMAAFPSRDREAFFAHWAKVLADPAAVVRTVLVGGRVAGSVMSWERDGGRLVGYWVGKEFWGRGVATAALGQFLDVVRERPLTAWVARHNVGSVRVLEKCGFAAGGTGTGADRVEEVEYTLADPGGGHDR
jgi:RimJ/RimL family protein N-acetyltransferase